MASIIDAFEESFHDHNAFIKFVIFAIPVYYCIDLFSKESMLFGPMSSIVFILLFGFLIKCTYNVRNGKNYVLPNFNIFAMLWSGIKGLIALGPIIAICSICAIYLSKYLGNFFPDPNSIIVWNFIIWGLFASFMMTGYLSYARNFKIADAYNFKTIANSCVDVFVGVLFMIPQVAIVDAIIVAPITYIIWLFFGIPHPIAIFFWCMCFIFNLSLVGHYLAQLDYEAISDTDKENDNFI